MIVDPGLIYIWDLIGLSSFVHLRETTHYVTRINKWGWSLYCAVLVMNLSLLSFHLQPSLKWRSTTTAGVGRRDLTGLWEEFRPEWTSGHGRRHSCSGARSSVEVLSLMTAMFSPLPTVLRWVGCFFIKLNECLSWNPQLLHLKDIPAVLSLHHMKFQCTRY